MAMVSASTGAMNSVIAKLTALLADEDKRLTNGVRNKKNMAILKDELASMKGLLEKMADKEELDPLVKGWMNQVREMTYDLEDGVDEGTQQLPAAASGDAKSGFMKKTVRRIKRLRSNCHLASQLEEMKARILEASERRLRYRLDDPAGNQTKLRCSSSMSSCHVTIDPGLLQLTPDVGSLVGIDGPRDGMIDWLTADGQKQLKVASIVGSGGMGKTTLAMEVYRCLKGRFDCHAVVSMSRRPDLFKILRSILFQVRPDDEHGFTQYDDVDYLIEKLRAFLHDKRYFIIIDDLWDTSAWQVIRWAFPENDCGSRILVTTRLHDVARSCCYSRDGVTSMRPLADYEARKLFFRRIFHSEDHCPPHLKEASAGILQICSGLPLAIITVSGLLATKTTQEEEWMRVQDCIGSTFGKRSVSLEGLSHILNLCYVDLPLHLRTCLLYMNIVPEDYIIERKRLIWRWMAEGFIVKEHGKSLEEVGECYFSELINRGLIQPVGIHYNGRIEACQVHDIILDLIRYKSSEENFVTIYDDRDCIAGLQDKVRRLSIHSGHDREGTFMTSAMNYSHVRSLSIFMSNKEMPDLAIFRALRVLDLESNGRLEEHLRNVGRLHLLRYLRLETTSLSELPEQIAELKLLQTLDLTHAPIRRLPLNIIQLKKLIHLLVTDAKLPDGIGELQDLQELSHVVVESSNSASSLEELGRLTKLRVLGLKWCISGTDADMKKCADSLVSSLNKLSASSLQSLHIGSDPGCSLDFLLDSLSGPFYRLQEFQMTSDYYLPRIPEWMASLVSLRLLKINIDIVGEEVLLILGELPSLLILLLSAKKSACPEQGLVIRRSGFHCLKEFDFICEHSLAMLMFEPGNMPELQKLQLKLGAKGACVDDGFHCGIDHLASLKHLCVDINCVGAQTEDVAAVENAIKSAVNAHPNRPELELQRLGEADIEEDMVEIRVHGEEEKGHNDEEDIDVVEEELKPTTES